MRIGHVQVRVGIAQSPWSLPLPSPASPTMRSRTCAPVTSTSIDVAGWCPRMVGVVTRVLPSAATLKVTVPAGATLHFRYLAEGGIWFDDEAVPHKDAQGGYVTV